MPLYVDDLTTDTESLPLEAFGAWVKCLCVMWKREQAGISERSTKHWGRRWGCSQEEAEDILDELETVASVDYHEDGSVTIHSGRMEEELSTLEQRRAESRDRKKRWREGREKPEAIVAKNPRNEDVPRSERVPNASVPRSAIPLSSLTSLSSSELSERKEKREKSHWAIERLRETQGSDRVDILWLDALPKRITNPEAWNATLALADGRGWSTPYNPAILIQEYNRVCEALQADGTNQQPLTKSQLGSLTVEQRLIRGGYRPEDFEDGGGDPGGPLGDPAQRPGRQAPRLAGG